MDQATGVDDATIESLINSPQAAIIKVLHVQSTKMVWQSWPYMRTSK